MAASTFGQLAGLDVILSVAIFALLYVTGFLINAITDREVDLKYGSFKKGIGSASQRLGNRTILALIALHLLVGFVLTGILAMRLSNPWLIPLAAVGVFLALAYSAPPFAFKLRGVGWHALSLSLSAFTVPFLFLYIAARGTLDAEGLFVVGAFSVVGYSLEYANQAYDFTEDLEAGLATPVVRLGLVRSVRLAVYTFFLALPVLTFALTYLALSRGAVAFAVGPSGGLLVAAAAGAAVSAGYAVSIRGMVRIYRASKEEGLDSNQLVERVRGECNYALWQSSGVGGLFAFAVVVFVLTSTSVSQVHAMAPRAFSFDGPVTYVWNGTASPLELTFEGSISAADFEGQPFSHGELWLDFIGPLARESFPADNFELPAGRGFTSFSFNVPAPRIAGPLSISIRLMVDTDFDGKVDYNAASAMPVWG